LKKKEKKNPIGWAQLAIDHCAMARLLPLLQRVVVPVAPTVPPVAALALRLAASSSSSSSARSPAVEELDGLGKTAQFVAHCRFLESQAPSPLFVDPFAAKFAGAGGRAFFDKLVERSGLPPESLTTYFSTRTKFLDDIFMDSVSRGVQQVVITGVGGDTRAYRLTPPKGKTVAVFELDFPGVMEYRKKVLAGATPTCSSVQSISCNLGEPSWSKQLVDAGYNPRQSSLWLIEGVLPYLTEAQVNTFLSAIASLTTISPSTVAGDVINTHCP
jgi:methyltransferase (TIGR00027 family)